MKKLFLIFTSILFACNSDQNELDKTENITNLDTVSFNLINHKALINLEATYFNNYYKRFGIAIQQYFQTTDSLPIDLDLNGSVDTIVILTPKSLMSAEYFNKSVDSLPKRLLVEIMNIDGKSKIRNIYQNLISDVGGVLSKYNSIVKTDEGFMLKHEAGNKYTWQYNVEFSVRKKDKIALKKIYKICGYDDEVVTQESNYNNYSIEKINLLDTMKMNCNCDSSWKLLENKAKNNN